VTTIRVTALDPGWYGVETEQGGLHTGHRIYVSPQFLDDLALFDVDPGDVARETVAYLLDRETEATVPAELSVEDLANSDAGYTDELLARLSG
jgi:hypothetical protein